MTLLAPLICALALSAAPPKPFTQVASIEGITEYRLPNGLKVLFVPDASQATVTVDLTVFVGSRMENYGEKGMAHLFEHMLFKKTKRIADIKQALTEHGGDANGNTDFDRTTYFETIPATDANLQWALDMESQRLVDAVISRELLAPEMTVVRNEFEMGENRPEGVLWERVMSSAFTWHNYGDTVIGARSDIERVPTERLQAFYETWYQPDNAMLMVAGKFDEARTFKYVADAFGRIPRPKRVLPTTYTVEPTQDGERTTTVRRVGGAPYLMVGYHVPAGTDPDYAAIDVLDRVLGDAPSGRLYTALVDAMKAAKTNCFNLQQHEPGYFLCAAELKAGESAQAAREALVATVEGVAKQPVTKDEVARAQASILKNYDLVLNTPDRLVMYLAEFAAMGDWRMMFLHRDRVRQVTPEEVTRVATRYFKGANRTLGEYVPTEAPDRAEVPAPADLTVALQGYRGDAVIAAGEVFDASPANIDARTTRTALPSGLQLALLPKKTRGQTVQVAMKFDFGTQASLTGQSTAARALARLLTRGTRTKTRQQFKDEVDRLKLSLHFQPLPQGVQASFEVRRPNLLAALDLVAEALTQPALDPREFETLKRELQAELDQRKDDPSALGWNELQRALAPFPKGHPLAVPTYAEMAVDTAALKLEQVKAFHARFYGAKWGQVAVVGDFDATEVTERLTRHFGTWAGQEAYVRIAVPFQDLAPTTLVTQTPDKPMAFFGAGLPFAMKDGDPDYPALRLADYMLGGGFLNGRVPKRLREKDGLSYGAGTFTRVDARDDFSLFMGYAISAAPNADRVEKGFREEVALAVAKGFTEAELKLARQGLLQQREQERANDEQLVETLREQAELARTMRFEQAQDDRFKALKLGEVNAALKKYVDPAKLIVVKVGDFKKVEAPR